ncbi:MAG: EutN/CcmL family microcompartment protein [Burkholderiales bacterium]|nr:EutN/CcmL family microcompartment protein [Phycisphaerae bacterium]
MQLGRIIGHATSTIKHPSMQGWRMLIVQPLNGAKLPEADPVIAMSGLNTGIGQVVVLNNDGKAARDLIGQDKTPVRWFVIGIVDEQSGSDQGAGA